VLVPLTLAPYVTNLGLAAFAAREVARGRAPRVVIGSAGLPLLAVGVVTAAAAFPVAAALAGGRETVRVLLVVGFLMMPISLLGGLLSACLGGLERWRRMIWSRAIAFGVPFVAIVVLYAAGRLTVATAAAFTLAGGVLAILPAVGLLTEGGRPVFVAPVAREGIAFGLKSWIGGLALLANARLDQLLMITVVTPRELGLYVVAFTLANAPGLATGAVTPPLMARVSAGQADLLPRALRVTLAVSALLNLALAVAAPVLLPLLFGHEFLDAVPMAIVLLTAGVPYAGATILTSGLQADGAPAVPSIGEGIALVITVAGLALLLGPLGGLGAALVSLLAYSASFGFQLVMARRRIPAPLRTYLIPSRADLSWARSLRR
jgi:O-antigen/teichoic acid export membrane protein